MAPVSDVSGLMRTVDRLQAQGVLSELQAERARLKIRSEVHELLFGDWMRRCGLRPWEGRPWESVDQRLLGGGSVSVGQCSVGGLPNDCVGRSDPPSNSVWNSPAWEAVWWVAAAVAAIRSRW